MAHSKIDFTLDNLKSILSLHPKGVSYNTLLQCFNAEDELDSQLRKHLEALVDEGFCFTQKRLYTPRTPMADLLVVRLTKPSLKEKWLELEIEGVEENFPFGVKIKRTLVQKKIGSSITDQQRLLVSVERRHGLELVATGIVDVPKRGKDPKFVGYFNAAAKVGYPFNARMPGVSATFRVAGEYDSQKKSKAPHIAHIPADYNPYDPSVLIGEQKWDPDSGRLISEVIAHKYRIPTAFDEETEREALELTEKPIKVDQRRDLRQEQILVIDPADARDHDDGILIQRLKDGRYRSLVVIADVPYYVPYGSKVDQAAQERGFTSYFPDTFYPMLPKSLTHALSLTKGASKAVICVEQFYDEYCEPDGVPDIFPGVIAAQKQMTYGAFDDEIMRGSFSAYKELGDVLVQKMREEKITFDMDEQHQRATYAQMLVSSLMIHANAAIAEYCDQNNIPFLSRTHSGSCNILAFESLRDRLTTWGYDVPETIGEMNNDVLRDIITQAMRRRDQERVERLIRSEFLDRAIYSTIPYGHFGLGLDSYTHATSPLRRYCDLLTLRALADHWGFDHGHALELNELRKEGDKLNHLQDVQRSVQNDRQTYYGVRDLARLEGQTIKARIQNITSSHTEIILDRHGGLRKTISHGNLPEGWRHNHLHNSINACGYPLRTNDLVRVRIADVRPLEGTWGFSHIEPVMAKRKPGGILTPNYT